VSAGQTEIQNKHSTISEQLMMLYSSVAQQPEVVNRSAEEQSRIP
jgi:hypothetical protein